MIIMFYPFIDVKYLIPIGGRLKNYACFRKTAFLLASKPKTMDDPAAACAMNSLKRRKEEKRHAKL
jgi:hypothetical protein